MHMYMSKCINVLYIYIFVHNSKVPFSCQGLFLDVRRKIRRMQPKPFRL